MALSRIARRPLESILHPKTFRNYATPITHFTDSKTTQNSPFELASRHLSSQGNAVTKQMNLIRLLRERTSAPIKDVKAAPVESNWDIDAAQTELRKKGKVLAAKKSGRRAAEGLLALAQNEGKAVVIELNCETDFVTRNDIFQYLALSLAKQALSFDNVPEHVSGVHAFGPECWEELKLNLEHPKLSGGTSVHNAITEIAAMMGENVNLRRGFMVSVPSTSVLATYLHNSPQPGLGRIAVILSLESEGENLNSDALRSVGSELAMHVVASKPLFLTKEFVASDALEKEREILKSQAESTGKNPMVVEKLIDGRLRKYFEEVVLLEQNYFLNDKVNVKTVLNDLSKEVGSPVKIGSFFRMEVGEGVERLEASDEPVAQAA